MSTLAPSRPASSVTIRTSHVRYLTTWHLPLLLLFWIAIFATSLASPPLLDDADATHAQAAQAMLHSGDWVTLHVDGVRYLEKAPLPYWIAACSLGLFGENAFAIHLPLALAVLGLAALGYRWARRSFGPQTAFYTALFTLTSVGPFLFTRIFIPDALLSLLLALVLYSFLRALDTGNSQSARNACTFWIVLALAVLTKGLVAVLFTAATTLIFLLLTRRAGSFARLRPGFGLPLFLLIAAPWHILAGLRNSGGADGHGFFWFYFVNEHVLRFLGRRVPRDYNKLPATWYWLLHFVWLFPWSFLLPGAVITAWRVWRQRRNAYYHTCKLGLVREHLPSSYRAFYGTRWLWLRFIGATEYATPTFAAQSVLLLSIFSASVMCFFALSTNQEYYTFPVYLPVLMLLAAALSQSTRFPPKAFQAGLMTLACLTLLAALVLAEGLLASRHLPATSDIGALLAHRNVGDYTLSLSHFFDLTDASLAALRLPACIAVIALVVGPGTALVLLRRQKHPEGAIFAIACMGAASLIAAHLALVRFAPILSSESFARTILTLESRQQVNADTQVIVLGDQAFGSSLPFYLRRPVQLVDGRSTSMLFGSTFPDVPPVFVSSQELSAAWGHGPRKLLFVPAEQRQTADRLLGPQQIVVFQSSGKELLTDRPLAPPQATHLTAR